MSATRVRFADLAFDLPDGWNDITDGPQGLPTLAKDDGIGVVQFTCARYGSGELPNFTVEVLTEILSTLFRQQGLSPPVAAMQTRSPELMAVGAVDQSNAVGAWCVSDGMNLAMVTYTGTGDDRSSIGDEIGDATTIVESLAFK